MKRIVKALAAALVLLASLGLWAAPVPPARPVRPLDAAGVRKWLTAGPLVMTWRGTEYVVTLAAGGVYLCGTAHAPLVWEGSYTVEAGRVHVNEWSRPANLAARPLYFSFPITLHADGRMGGAMTRGTDSDVDGDCYLRRTTKTPPKTAEGP